MSSLVSAWRDLPPVCSLAETADFLGYSPSTVKRRLLTGDDPALHSFRAVPNGEYRIPKDSIARLVGIDPEADDARVRDGRRR